MEYVNIFDFTVDSNPDRYFDVVKRVSRKEIQQQVKSGGERKVLGFIKRYFEWTFHFVIDKIFGRFEVQANENIQSRVFC